MPHTSVRRRSGIKMGVGVTAAISFICGAPLLYAEDRCHDNMEPRYVLFQPEANPLCVMCTHEADYRRPERTIGPAPPRHIIALSRGRPSPALPFVCSNFLCVSHSIEWAYGRPIVCAVKPLAHRPLYMSIQSCSLEPQGLVTAA